MALNFDFSNVESSTFEPLPAGKYHAALFEVEEKPSKSSEFDYLNVQFKILEGKDDAGNSAVNRRVWGTYSYNPKALFRLMSLLQACGYTEDEIRDPSFSFEPAELQGRIVKLSVGRRTYEGEIQNTVRSEAPANDDFDPEAAQTPAANDSAPEGAPSFASGEAKVEEDDLPFKVD